MNKLDSVLSQLFDQYLDKFIKDKNKFEPSLDIPRAMYLFALTEFFGKISYIAETGDVKKMGNSSHSFTYFVDNYFSSSFSGLGTRLYVVYRCGVMHTVYPKNCGLTYDANRTELFLTEEVGIEGQRYNIEVLNLKTYEDELLKAIATLKDKIQANSSMVDQLYVIIERGDIFGDESASKQY